MSILSRKEIFVVYLVSLALYCMTHVPYKICRDGDLYAFSQPFYEVIYHIIPS